MTAYFFQWNGQNYQWLFAGFIGWILVSCTPSSPPSGMIWIAPGPFLMGTNIQDTSERGLELGLTKPWFEDETPARSINLPGYYIDRYEVTNREYAEFIKATNSIPPSSWKEGAYPTGEELYPITHVNWFQADAHCRWTNKRLPHESEWEKAARGTEGFIYPWGNDFEIDRANLLSDGPAPVGSLPQGASPFQVEDLIGNAWEWTADWYAPYPGNSFPSDSYGKRYKVIRGKSWTEGYGHFSQDESQEILRHDARASYRLFFGPTFSFGDLGFRCVKDA